MQPRVVVRRALTTTLKEMWQHFFTASKKRQKPSFTKLGFSSA
ncbi:hypothetical protein [Evansella cellulosilytica]|uniref:Uncharacterized protein n=1 Tax=Evansella cellulosilytica (strain ATCC 21833 / DSM 2522 / FERM P-1141 / JCM 9156 / N-4) TaxID=649639 RepID=E6TQT2_EVAC2|nr:hypothetical protein [Evansella cellulosilytica]ADU31707.1 hypothetical protein Bcell_3465 [Evansella cellulosilytica DSM 2522]